jgi:hypothetical protein
MAGNNPGCVNFGDSLGQVTAALAASGLAAGWVPGVRDVLAPAAAGLLLAFEVGALLLARERETSVRSE